MNEQPKTGIGAYLVAIVGAFLIMFVLVRAMQEYSTPPPFNQERAELRKKTLTEMQAANTAVLNDYAWQDSDKGLVRLPIARAMELTIQEAQNPAASRAKILARLADAIAPPVYE